MPNTHRNVKKSNQIKSNQMLYTCRQSLSPWEQCLTKKESTTTDYISFTTDYLLQTISSYYRPEWT